MEYSDRYPTTQPSKTNITPLAKPIMSSVTTARALINSGNLVAEMLTRVKNRVPSGLGTRRCFSGG